MRDRVPSFGELYRAAFAECDPHKRAMLLKRVNEAIDLWRSNAEGSQPIQQAARAKADEVEPRITRVA